MNEIKVSVSIMLPGSILLTQDEAEHLEKSKTGIGYDLTKIRVTDKKGKVDILNVRTRKTKTATQTINMCKEAYYYMTGKDGCPVGIKQFIWAKMKPIDRLKANLDLLCQHLNGISYTFKVFDD